MGIHATSDIINVTTNSNGCISLIVRLPISLTAITTATKIISDFKKTISMSLVCLFVLIFNTSKS